MADYDEFENDGFAEDLEEEDGTEVVEEQDDGFKEDLEQINTPAQEELRQILEPKVSPEVTKLLTFVKDKATTILILTLVAIILIIGIKVFANMTRDGVDVGGIKRMEDMFDR